MLDYGSVYSFWLFAFERFNYIVSSIHTSKREQEIQLMRQIVKFNVTLALKPMLVDALPDGILNNSTSCKLTSSCSQLSMCYKNQFQNEWSIMDCISLPKQFKTCVLDDDDKVMLAACYKEMYGAINFNVPSHFRRYNYVMIGNEKFGSVLYGRS